MWIAAIGVLAGGLMLLGENANQAADKIAKVQEANSQLQQSTNALTSKASGVLGLADQYQTLQKRISDANAKGQNTVALNNQLKTVEDNLAKSMGLTTTQFEQRVKQSGSFKSFVDIYLTGIANMINANNQLIRSNGDAQFTDLQNKLKIAQRQREAFEKDAQSALKSNPAREESNWDSAYNTDKRYIKDLDGYINQLKKDIAALPMSNLKDVTVADLRNMDGTTIKTGNPDPGDTKVTDKIAKIVAAYNNEIAEIDNLAAMYKKLGIEYDAIKPKIDAANNAITSIGKLDPTNAFISKTAKDLAQWQPQEIINQLSTKLRGVTEQLMTDIANDNQSGILKDYTEQVNIFREAIKALGSIDPTNPKIAELTEQMKLLNEQAEGAKRLQKAQEEIDNNKLGQADVFEMYSPKQVKYVTSALDSVSSALSNLGTAAGDAAAEIADVISKNFGKDGFDWETAASDMMSKGIDKIAGGVIGYVLGDYDKNTTNKWQDNGYSVSGTMSNFKNFEANQAQYNDISKKLGQSQFETQIVSGVLTTVGAVIGSIFGPIGGAIGGFLGNLLGGLFGSSKKSQEQEWQEELQRLQEALGATWGELKKALGTGIEDIANALGQAFQSSNYMDFLSNWNQSLYDMTRQALIKAFMAQEAYQGLYSNLSDIITVAVMDGTLNANEISAIKTAGNAVASKMGLLYQALGLLDSSFPGANQNSSSSNSYSSGSSVPITYNNYITIEAGVFVGSEDSARQTALWLNGYIKAEEARA